VRGLIELTRMGEESEGLEKRLEIWNGEKARGWVADGG
jgi:hypothetical protein